MTRYVAYHRLWACDDVRESYPSLEAAKFAFRLEKDMNFHYFNLCIICEDGSEEIVCSNVDELKDLK